jgi:hypothetical protein
MDRVAFLVEPGGPRLAAMLNPNSVSVRRHAGLAPRRSGGGKLTGAAAADDPLLFTGGGRTELTLDLLFDISVAGSTVTTDDVRVLTAPFWDLSESATGRDGLPTAPTVRFVWGKSWNVPGLVSAVAERLEQFTAAGAPQRSWLRMRLLRVSDRQPGESSAPAGSLSDSADGLAAREEQIEVHQVVGGGQDEEAAGERLEDIAFVHYGDPSAWRVIAAFNGIADPARIPPGTILRIPPRSALEGPG